jgi:exosortase K
VNSVPHGAPRGRADRVAGATAIGLALGVAWGLKDFYRRAGFDDLRWVLAPTTRLVEWWTGASFQLEAHRAFVSRELLYEIVPACAGVNFMVVAFVSLAVGLQPPRATPRARLAWIVASGLAAYGATVVANAARIAIAIPLHQSGASLGPLTPGRLHCAEGVAVYLASLGLLHAIGARVTGAERDIAF